MKIQSLRGTKDIYGEDALLWEHVEAVAREIFRRYDFAGIRTPIIEDKTLFTRSVGETTDIVQKEMYQVQSRGGENETDIVLRPEGTASIVRAVFQNNILKEGPTTRLFYYGPMFRAERPQAGRFRQFSQIGAEYFGNSSPYADAEVIDLMIRFYEALGVKDWRLLINNLGEPEDRKQYAVVLKNYLVKHAAKLCKDCQARTEKNVMRVLDCKVRECQPILEEAPKIGDHVSNDSRKRYDQVKKLLGALNIKFTENPRIVRGLDYYTHTVFELVHDELGAQNALAAGGRYDGLSENLGEDRVSAVGFALGIERLVEILKKKAAKPWAVRTEPRVAVVAMDEIAKDIAFLYASILRRGNFSVIMDISRSRKSQLRQANKEGAHWTIILGENELRSRVVRLKDMAGRIPEKDVNQEDFLANLERHLPLPEPGTVLPAATSDEESENA